MSENIQIKTISPKAQLYLINDHRDFCGIDLSGRSLRKSDMSSLLLAHSKLIDSNLEESNFLFANLCHADLSRSTLKNCDFRKANLEHIRYKNADFRGALYDSQTLLPFTTKIAKKLGMIFKRTPFAS